MNLHTSRITRYAAASATTALLASALLATPAMAAPGAPSISYNAQTNTLTVDDGTGSTDLFTNFKGVVPGDTITQDVAIELTNVEHPTRLYLRADTAGMDPATVAALSEGVTLSVAFDDANGLVAEPQSDAPTEVFAEDANVLIAEVTEPTTTTMRLTLSVDTSVGNEIADMRAEIPWVVTVEEEDDAVTPPDDGDDETPAPQPPADDDPTTPPTDTQNPQARSPRETARSPRAAPSPRLVTCCPPWRRSSLPPEPRLPVRALSFWDVARSSHNHRALTLRAGDVF